MPPLSVNDFDFHKMEVNKMEVSKTQGIFGPPQADFLGNSLVKTHFPTLIETVPRFEERSKNRKKNPPAAGQIKQAS